MVQRNTEINEKMRTDTVRWPRRQGGDRGIETNDVRREGGCGEIMHGASREARARARAGFPVSACADAGVMSSSEIASGFRRVRHVHRVVGGPWR